MRGIEKVIMNKSKKIKITAAQREKGSLQGKTGRACPFSPGLCALALQPGKAAAGLCAGERGFFSPRAPAGGVCALCSDTGGACHRLVAGLGVCYTLMQRGARREVGKGADCDDAFNGKRP